ncbi:hypothetical protein [Streptacidiphilus anmyonensis]|uniref:hypothetical protein n=1 Tax=Streptacidiphilus anmyonensis TaxID=405782 RepID=UPI00128BFBBD|nr:hypothetical protein [Streptacidiphilus anmyonensis]
MVAQIVTRFPAAWLAEFTGDWIRVVTTVRDFGRKSGRCFASDQTIADRLGLSRGGVNRLVGQAEAADVIRSEYNPRTGTRDRVVRPVRDEEVAVCVSARARADLAGNRFKVYGALALREHLQVATSAAQLAAMCQVTVATARTVTAGLVADGWVSREGAEGGAFRYTVHAAPLAGVATQEVLFAQPQQTARTMPSEASSENETGVAAAAVCTGQLELFGLAGAEVTPLDPVTATPADLVTAAPHDLVTQAGSLDQDLVSRQEVVGGCSSAVGATCVPREQPVDKPSRTPPVGGVAVVAPSADPTKTSIPFTPTSPTLPLTVSPSIYAVLSVVPMLVARMNRWQQRQAAKAVAQAIREADGDVDRITDRVLRRYAPLDAGEIRDAYAWLVHRGLTRRGCRLPLCESGTDLVTGSECRTCGYHRERAQGPAAAYRQEQAAPRPQSPDGAVLPTLTVVPQPATPADLGRTCPIHRGSGLPCAMCAPSASTWPGTAVVEEPTVASPDRPPAWASVDSAEGVALREHLAARRRQRERVRPSGRGRR